MRTCSEPSSCFLGFQSRNQHVVTLSTFRPTPSKAGVSPPKNSTFGGLDDFSRFSPRPLLQKKPFCFVFVHFLGYAAHTDLRSLGCAPAVHFIVSGKTRARRGEHLPEDRSPGFSPPACQPRARALRRECAAGSLSRQPRSAGAGERDGATMAPWVRTLQQGAGMARLAHATLSRC